MAIQFHKDIPKAEAPKPRVIEPSQMPAAPPKELSPTKLKRRPNGSPKKLLSLRVDPEVIEVFKAAGEGWQGRMNDALREKAGLNTNDQSK